MPKFANIFLFNRLPAPGGGGILYYGFSGSKVTTINYSTKRGRGDNRRGGGGGRHGGNAGRSGYRQF